MTTALVLAAGAGRRLGGVAKALLRLDSGESFMEAITETLRQAGVGEVVIVLGPPHEKTVLTEAQRLGLDTVVSEDAEQGMSRSVEAGFRHLLQRSASSPALLWPVDQPWVRAETVTTLIASASGGPAVVPTWQGRGGHPVVISSELWPTMARCSGFPEGARGVLRGASNVLRLAVDDAAVVRDVDHPEDL